MHQKCSCRRSSSRRPCQHTPPPPAAALPLEIEHAGMRATVLSSLFLGSRTTRPNLVLPPPLEPANATGGGLCRVRIDSSRELSPRLIHTSSSILLTHTIAIVGFEIRPTATPVAASKLLSNAPGQLFWKMNHQR